MRSRELGLYFPIVLVVLNRRITSNITTGVIENTCLQASLPLPWSKQRTHDRDELLTKGLTTWTRVFVYVTRKTLFIVTQ